MDDASALRILPESPASLQEALQVLLSGGIVIHATETCYGLACDLRNPIAVARLFTVKDRPLEQPVSALFSSIEDAKKYVEWNDRAEALAKEFLPGPLTLILHARKDIPYTIHITPAVRRTIDDLQPATCNPKQATIGVRISSHPFAMQLAQAFGAPISTTSANVHGKPSPYSAAEILEQYENMREKPDLILDAGPLPFRKPSRIIDCTGTSDILRRP
jgi:L-threonylcarbamoyladenylate synthase